ncbi:MAG: hypothetical protein IJI92_08415 [Erysipelotrichaceae bacterium]|nr:hypothetical protein [Erysipelotrichaceae bacterium]
MKKIISKFLVLMLLCIFCCSISAEEEKEDMTVWSFKILEQHCDQESQIKVVKYFNNQTGKVGFCMEPNVNYNRFDYDYYKQVYDNEDVCKIVRAYEYFNDDEHYICAQLMIWDTIFHKRYSFSGKTAADFDEEGIKEVIASFSSEIETQELNYDGIKGKINHLDINDLNSFEISCEGIEIISKDENGLDYTINEGSDTHIIELKSKVRSINGSYLYCSEGSQDLYSYEGNYEQIADRRINIRPVTDEITIKLKKTDTEGRPISGAEFILYDLNSYGPNETLYMMQINKRINLFQMIIDDYPNYDPDKISISVSERYSEYLDGLYMKTDETGYFPFEIRYNDVSLRKGRVYVMDDPDLTLGEYRKIKVKMHSQLSTGSDLINMIENVAKDHMYLLCESEPQKGYEYSGNPCQLIDASERDENDLNTFINSKREYTFRLVKNDPDHTINLNGARFRMIYQEDGEEKEMEFVTGAFNVRRKNGRKYIYITPENSKNTERYEMESDFFIKRDLKPGRYYYYQSDDAECNNDKIYRHYVDVIEGGFILEDLPYDSVVSLEEIEAPEGYHIDEAEFDVRPDISYSELIFRCSRVNSFEIIPANRRKIPKTCIGD